MKTSVDQITERVLVNLWHNFRRRIPYADTYARLTEESGGSFIADHIAFRTFNARTGEQPQGIEAISHIIKNLHYVKSGTCRFDKHKVKACLFEHEYEKFPSIFVSELEVTELPPWAGNLILETVYDAPYLLSDEAIELTNYLASDGYINAEAAEVLVEELTGYFRRPWNMPRKETMLRINDVSQYAAWVLLHGNSVCHFAAAVNELDTPWWPDIESACRALERLGVPMKREIAGERGSKLRQAVTLPFVERYAFPAGSEDFDEMDWTYAFFELTGRGYVGEGNDQKLFRGFIAEQSSQIMNTTMTREY